MAKKDLGTNIFLICLHSLLKPISKFCIRRSIKFQDFISVAKEEFIIASREQLNDVQENESISRLSIMTGLQRKDILRVSSTNNRTVHSADLLSRVLSSWSQGKDWQSKKTGRPRPLTYEGKESEFARLVKSVSSDLNHHTVLFELERVNAVSKDSENSLLTLVDNEYITYDDPEESFALLGRDIDILTRTVEENVSTPLSNRHLHAMTRYDNISEHQVSELRKKIKTLGREFHDNIRYLLSSADLDCNPKLESKTKGGWIINVGTFSLIEQPRNSKVAPNKTKKTGKI